MQLFTCGQCGHTVYFENVECLNCGAPLAFDATSLQMTVPATASTDHYCDNYAHDACNWLANDEFCVSCALNRTIPDLANPEFLERWRRLEAAKRRMVYGLLRFGLPVIGKDIDPERGLAFDFLADGYDSSREGKHVLTGHADGLITINIAEADPAHRETMRADLGERYRTLLGHFRHEVGHYYWERLIKDANAHAQFRQVFGDERADYGKALDAHYAQPDDGSWRDTHISHYAASHPWEDWAESWAHIMHMVDTLDTAQAYGLSVDSVSGGHEISVNFDPYRCDNFDALLAAWQPVAHAMNSLNRSMGKADAYPFVLPQPVVGKLAAVHGYICAARAAG